MTILTDIFPNGFTAPQNPAPLPAEHQFRVAMSDAGLTPPDDIIFDGKLHRFSTNGKRSDAAGWYVAFDGQVPAGAFGDWRAGMETTWKADIGRDLTMAEQMANASRMRELKAIRDAELAALRENAAEQAKMLWEQASLASDEHPYIQRKGVSNPGWRLAPDGRLIAPMLIDNEIVGLQYIDANGQKMFMKGSKAAGAWWHLGAFDNQPKVYLVEGVATAASVFEATGKPVVIAYFANNLAAVAHSLRQKIGQTVEIVIVADNDQSGTGEREAKRAADMVGGCTVLTIPTEGDANDYAQGGGDLLGLLEPKHINDGWLVAADDFSAQPAPIGWIVKNWVQEQALIMVHGPSGCGKTFLVLDWCLSIASHKEDWAGHRVKHGEVVYLAGEGHHGLRGRVAAWKHHNQVKKLSMWLSKDGCDLNTPEGYLRVVKSIRNAQAKPTIIVVDTLHRFLEGSDESSKDAKTMIDACNSLTREFECSVLLVHHTGVSEEAQHRGRGSSSWRGALDIEVSVVPAKGDEPIQVIQRKSKDAELANNVYGKLQSVAIPNWFDEDGEQVTSAIFVIDDAPILKEKKESNIQKEIRKFNNAWWHSGAEERESAPYLSRSALINYLIENEGLTETTAKTYAQGSKKGRMIYNLLTSEIIVAHEHGWIISDPTTASTMMIRKSES
jgi:putative DNA primase/helicase